jgi:hypothetical protein
VKPLPTVPPAGRSEIVGEDGVAPTTCTVWGRPVAAANVELAATSDVSEHVPVATKVTTRPLTVQTATEFEVSEVVPLLVVVIVAVKPLPTVPPAGRSEIVGADGVGRLAAATVTV